MRGIIQVNGTDPVIGEFAVDYKMIEIKKRESQDVVYIAKSYDVVKDIVFFSLIDASYHFKKDYNPEEIIVHTNRKLSGMFPYKFGRRYEAIDNFDLFKDKQVVKEKKRFAGTSTLNYTFGLEFETSLGCIPEDQCYIDGLIPLRDGSISAPEYSTVVLNGSEGINLLYQQLKNLRQYTTFNKECSLHMHFGGYPVQPEYIFTLYSLFVLLERNIVSLTNKWVFNTSRYKRSGKDYCISMNREIYHNFDDLYRSMVGINFYGDLTQPHPCDRNHEAKWNIHSRYKSLNLINMVCYKNPKTVEFRFLRPTYNFSKIYTWILIFNAILKYSEYLTKQYGGLSTSAIEDLFYERKVVMSIRDIIRQVYTPKLALRIEKNIDKLALVRNLQYDNGDYIGENTTFEDSIMKDEYIL